MTGSAVAPADEDLLLGRVVLVGGDDEALGRLVLGGRRGRCGRRLLGGFVLGVLVGGLDVLGDVHLFFDDVALGPLGLGGVLVLVGVRGLGPGRGGGLLGLLPSRGRASRWPRRHRRPWPPCSGHVWQPPSAAVVCTSASLFSAAVGLEAGTNYLSRGLSAVPPTGNTTMTLSSPGPATRRAESRVHVVQRLLPSSCSRRPKARKPGRSTGPGTRTQPGLRVPVSHVSLGGSTIGARCPRQARPGSGTQSGMRPEPTSRCSRIPSR